MDQGEIRRNCLTHAWVIFAPARGKRPRDFQREADPREPLPSLDPDCPFCPGREADLPSILAETPGGADLDWSTRVVPNKFPALSPSQPTRRHRKGVQLAMPGYGHHNVIIETPLHNQGLARMSADQARIVIETYHRRYCELIEEEDTQLVVLFRNHGPRAGTSLIHPHSQLIATGVIPRHIRRRERIAQEHFDDWGRCLMCEIVGSERKSGRRMVTSNEAFVAFVPYAAEVPFETWLVPSRHQASFGDTGETEREGLTLILQRVLSGLHDRLDDPDYNYVINTSAGPGDSRPYSHWFLQIKPRLTTPAGFEIGSGIRINPSAPEEDAAFLRSAVGGKDTTSSS